MGWGVNVGLIAAALLLMVVGWLMLDSMDSTFTTFNSVVLLMVAHCIVGYVIGKRMRG